MKKENSRVIDEYKLKTLQVEESCKELARR
jgi:hypothetical protein